LPVGRDRTAIFVGVRLALACVLGATCVARADVVELKNGQRVVGTVTDVAGAEVVIETAGREMRIPQGDVQSIVFESSPPAPPRAGEPIVPSVPATPAVVPPVVVPPVAVEPAPPPSAALPAPVVTPLAAALAALDRLQAASATPLAPDDYAARVETVRREVAPALGDATVPAEALAAIGAAIRYHAFAARMGIASAAGGDLVALGRDPLVAECRPLTELIAREASRVRLDPANPAIVGLFTVAEGAPALRTCAGERLAEAERQARAPR
jgi:hypothetical protein